MIAQSILWMTRLWSDSFFSLNDYIWFSGKFLCISDSQTIASPIKILCFPFLNLISFSKSIFQGIEFFFFFVTRGNTCSIASLQSHLHINELLLLSPSIVFILQIVAYLNKSFRPHIKFKNKKNWQYYTWKMVMQCYYLFTQFLWIYWEYTCFSKYWSLTHVPGVWKIPSDSVWFSTFYWN